MTSTGKTVCCFHCRRRPVLQLFPFECAFDRCKRQISAANRSWAISAVTAKLWPVCVQDLVKVASFGPFLIVSWSDGLQFVPLGPIHLRWQDIYSTNVLISVAGRIGWTCHFPDSGAVVAFAIVCVSGFAENQKADYLRLCQLLLLILGLSLSLFPSELIDIHLCWLGDRLQFVLGCSRTWLGRTIIKYFFRAWPYFLSFFGILWLAVLDYFISVSDVKSQWLRSGEIERGALW